MKTIDEWMAEWIDQLPYASAKDFFKRIQSEAYHEGQLAGLQMGKETAMKTIGEVFSKRAERESITILQPKV